MNFETSSNSTPYFASIRALLRVKSSSECQYASTPAGNITAFVILDNTNMTVNFDVTLSLTPTPPKAQRVLFDTYHNLKFPEDGYILRDSIFVERQPYEWKGDHPFTNYVGFYKYLTNTLGYTVEILTEPITCFDSQYYSVLILADPEKTFTKKEVVKLNKDIEARGLSLIVLAEWSDSDMIKKHRFTSEVSKKVWEPKIGGGNLLSVNTILKPYGIRFRESSYSGTVVVGEEKFKIESGAIIDKFPNKGFLFSGKLAEDKLTIGSIDDLLNFEDELLPVVGIYDLSDVNNNKESGSILVIGDSY